MMRLRNVEMTFVLLLAPALWAAEPNQATSPEKVVESIPVAIFDFESKAPGNPDLGQQLGDILTARLSTYDQFTLVERKRLQDVLAEMQLNLSGMVENRPSHQGRQSCRRQDSGLRPGVCRGS